MSFINIPPIGMHEAKPAKDFKVGEQIVMAHGNQYKIVKISKKKLVPVTFIEFSLECRLGRKSKLIKPENALLGCLESKND